MLRLWLHAADGVSIRRRKLGSCRLGSGCVAFGRPGAQVDRIVLHQFLMANREEILARARQVVGARSSPAPTELELTDGLPLFLAQLGDALLLVKAGGKVTHESISKSAGTHGIAVVGKGLTVKHAIHAYGDLCRVLTELALERDAPITVQEFVTLDRCLDDAIACAVTNWTEG